MKKYLLTIITLITLSINGYSQMAVTDATANAQLSTLNKSSIKAAADRASGLAKAAATLQQLKDLKSQYDKQLEMVEEISSYVKTSKQVINMKNLLVDITTSYTKGINYMYGQNTISQKDKNIFASVYSKMIDNALDDFDYGTKIIGDGTLKMNDAERLTILSQVESKMNKHKNTIRYFNNTVKQAVHKKKAEQGQQEYIQKNKNSFNQIKN